MQPKLIITFETLNEADCDAKAAIINMSLTGNVNFPTPWTAPAPQPADISAGYTDYHALFLTAQNGDHEVITRRDAARDKLTLMFKKAAPYLELIADGSVSKLQTIGYDLRHDIVRSTGEDPLPAPPNFWFERGGMGGTMVAKAEALPGAGSYHLGICAGDPAIEANWKDYGTFRHCSKIVVDGFIPGTVYYARLRGVGSNGPGIWAVSAGIMAV